MQWATRIGIAILVVVWSSLVLAEHGFGKCGERKAVLEHLERKYKEVVKYAAITGKGGFVEWTIAPGGSWSMLLTIPGGVTCLVSGGEEWQDRVVEEGKGI